jgi:TRAP-type transport system periplasmic protein
MKQRLSRRVLVGAAAAAGTQIGVPFLRSAAAAEAYTLRMNVTEGAASIVGMNAQRFAAAVKRRSNGQLQVEVYPNLQLAKEQPTIDALTTGAIDLAIVSAAFLVPLFPRYQIFTVPFLFKNFETGMRVLDGPVGVDFFSEIESKGIVGLGWGSSGFKEFETTSRAVVVPEDLKGVRMRTVAGAIYVAMYQAFGAIPITIDSSEVLVALTQHTVDGMDVNLDSMATGKYYVVAKHVALSHHVLSILPLLGSKRKIDALPVPLQKIMREEARNAMLSWRAEITRETANTISLLKSNGVAFTEIQYPAFRKAVEPVYALLQSRLGGDTLERVIRAAG